MTVCVTAHGYSVLREENGLFVAVVDGELLIKSVYEALRASPLWNETVLLVAWDEHGGFYDHVPPPSVGVPAPDNQTCVDCPFAFGFDRLGVRTPALIVSPWVQKGQVISTPPAQYKPTPSSQMELSSIPATLHHLFGTPNFLTARDAWAVPLHWVWNSTYSHLTAPRTDCPTELPSPPAQSPAFAGRQRGGINPMSALQRSLLLLGQAAARVANTTALAIDNLRKHGIDTEAEGGLFLKKIITRRLNWTPDDEARYVPNTGPSALERYLDVVSRHKAFLARTGPPPPKQKQLDTHIVSSHVEED
jgi:phospholipase C